MSDTASTSGRNLHGDDLLRELQHGWKALPNKTLFSLAMGGLRVRIMRSAVTMLSIVLAIAFLTYTGVTNYLTQNLVQIVRAMESRASQLKDGDTEAASAALLTVAPFDGMQRDELRTLADRLGMGDVKALEDELEYDVPERIRKSTQDQVNADKALAAVKADPTADEVDIAAAQARADRAAEASRAATDRKTAVTDQIAFGRWVSSGSGQSEKIDAMLLPSVVRRYEQLATRAATPGRLSDKDFRDIDTLFPAAARAGADEAMKTVSIAVAEEKEGRRAADLGSMLRKSGVNVRESATGNSMEIWLLVMAMLTCAIGIANAMLMSVTERFREIGTMKCLGAQDNLVVKLFLLESAFLGVVGAAAGIVFGLVVVLLGASLQYGSYSLSAFPVADSLLVIAMSVIGGILLAVVGAWYPAYTASRMKPVDALRVDE